MKYLNKVLDLELRQDESGYWYHTVLKKDVLFRISSPKQLRDFRILSGLLYLVLASFMVSSLWIGSSQGIAPVMILFILIKFTAIRVIYRKYPEALVKLDAAEVKSHRQPPFEIPILIMSLVYLCEYSLTLIERGLNNPLNIFMAMIFQVLAVQSGYNLLRVFKIIVRERRLRAGD